MLSERLTTPDFIGGRFRVRLKISMANKQKKKRNKKYQGIDAKVSAPLVTRVSAEERSRFKEWWLQYKQLVRIGATALGIIAVIILLIVGIVGLF